jgi:leader peptidase (prepilin peptidase)/N-methyltransferase
MDSCGFGAGCQAAATTMLIAGPALDDLSAAAAAISDRFPAMFPFVAAVVGGVAASLSGLAVHRLPRIHGWHGKPERNLSLSSPASHCDCCGAPLSALALVPVVGWLASRGKCPSCGAAVSPAYPAVEAAVALLSMTIMALYGPTWAGVSFCLALWALTFVSWLDWSEHVIPDGLSVPIFFLGLLASPFEPDVWARGAGAALAALCMLGAFKLTSALRDVDAVATGDIALAAALAAWVGFCAVPAFLALTSLSYLAYALPLRLRKKVTWVPMGPALAAGFVATALTGFKFAI